MFRKNIYVKNNLSPFKISRTKIDLFFDCKRCFYFDKKLGIKRPHVTALDINIHIVNKFKNLGVNIDSISPEIGHGMPKESWRMIQEWINSIIR